MGNKEFRNDIQGLRGIAILAVILYHMNPAWLSGGFVGVDIFFVISGYLVGGTVYGQVSAGTFRWSDFIARRIRRLAPALIAMLLTVTAVLMLLVGPATIRQQATIALSSLFGLSSFPLWKSAKYFGPTAETNPLLHTWSLSVEEQFYLLLPLAILVTIRWKRSRAVLIITVVSVVSLLAAELVVHSRFHTAAFFLLPFRAWELGLGLLAAIMPSTQGSRHEEHKYRYVSVIIAFLVLAVSCICLHPDSRFPGLAALPACAGTAVLLWYGPESPIGRMLSWRPLVWVGAVSYSLYLWHVPCLAIQRIITGPDQSALMGSAAMLTAIALSVLSYYLIEQPFRHPGKVNTRRFRTVWSPAACALMAMSLTAIVTKGYRELFPASQRGLFAQIDPEGSSAYVTQRFLQASLATSPFADTKERRILLVGDSFAQDFANVLAEGGMLGGVQLRTFYIPAICQPIYPQARAEQGWTPKDKPSCRGRESLQSVLPILKQVDTLIIAASWRQWSAESIASSMADLAPHLPPKVLLVGTKRIPTLSEFEIRQGRTKPVPRQPNPAATEPNQRLAALSEKYIVIDPMDMLADRNGLLSGTDDHGNLLSHDGDHLTRAGAQYLAARLQRDVIVAQHQ